MKGGNVKTQVDFNDLCVVVIQLSDLKNFLGDLKSEGQLAEFLEEKRNEMMNHLDSMEYLLKVIYLFIDSKVQVQDIDVPEVHDNTEAGIAIMKRFLEGLESEDLYEKFRREKIAEVDDSLNNLQFLLQCLYLFTYEAGLAIINEIEETIKPR